MSARPRLRVRQQSSNPGQFVRHDPSLPLVIQADERRRVKAIRQVGRIRDTYGARIYGATVPVASRAHTGRIYYAPDRRQWREAINRSGAAICPLVSTRR